jgi:lipid-binding SYLF domain-containing protein
MKKLMSIASRRELLENAKAIYHKAIYHKATWLDKGRVLDGLIAARRGYNADGWLCGVSSIVRRNT